MPALRFTIANAGTDVEDRLFEVLAEIPSSWTRDGSSVAVWVEQHDAEAARAALHTARLASESSIEEDRDWVSAAADLQRPVEVGSYLLDPHEGARATPAGARTRLFVPATRAFGTGSHESTRLALRLLLEEGVRGRRVLDLGCGAGTLAMVAAKEGAGFVAALDIDPDAAFETRDLSRVNGVSVAPVAGPLAALGSGSRFDVVVANMIHEELAPLLAGVRASLAPAGRFLTAGQLAERQWLWAEALTEAGFAVEAEIKENGWTGTRARLRANASIPRSENRP
jgi:ribosomal protein L11 methyltransferase